MKIIDKYLLKSFLSTLTTVFVILFFIFILQSIWLFINELAGKDLDVFMIMKFLLFSMPRIVPLVLPLSILLASIMTFGDLSEAYEFAAMKSAGISFQRIWSGLIAFIFLLSILAFFFANNVIPYAEYKFINFRRNIAQMKPALAIVEGQFSDVGVYNIKVNKKLGDDGKILKGITIHKKAIYGEENKTVIKAKDGELVSSSESNILQLVLNDGYYYEDIVPKDYEDRNKNPFVKSKFKRDVINIDLAKLNGNDSDSNQTNSKINALGVKELTYTIDSLNKNLKTEIISFSENSNQRLITPMYHFGLDKKDTIKNKKSTSYPLNLLKTYINTEKQTIINSAINNVDNTLSFIKMTINDLETRQKEISSREYDLYEKFVIAFSCYLMFFIGAPLGAIIRKGGLGLPIVFAVLIFISFHFINTFGKRISQENGLNPFLGAWMSSIILSPLAIFFTYRATNDSGLINFDLIFTPLQKFFKNKIYSKIFKKYKKII